MKKALITEKLDQYSKVPLEYGLGIAKNLGLFPSIIHVDKFADLNTYNHVFAGLNIEIQDDYFQKILDSNNERLANKIKTLDVDFDELSFETLAGDPADAIIEFSKNPEIDLIILGNENKTIIDKIFIGSVSEKVINQVEKSVLMIKKSKFIRPKKIMVPFDFSENCEDALEKALFIAKKNEAQVVLVNVLECHYDGVYASYVVKNGLTEAMTEMVEENKSEVSDKFNNFLKKNNLEDSVSYKIVLDRKGRISETLMQFASENDCDFIVMGSHKRGKIMRTLLGSVSNNLIKNATQPILIVK